MKTSVSFKPTASIKLNKQANKGEGKKNSELKKISNNDEPTAKDSRAQISFAKITTRIINRNQ